MNTAELKRPVKNVNTPRTHLAERSGAESARRSSKLLRSGRGLDSGENQRGNSRQARETRSHYEPSKNAVATTRWQDTQLSPVLREPVRHSMR